ncbi:hypothetical protein ACFWRZ_08370 [Streptomyces rubiginosohelvolus]|uniref:hypothetical protein n=1 Tax=Streptomyces rubiginosohelvolus TaxID=67362 RepID=UPI00365550D4
MRAWLSRRFEEATAANLLRLAGELERQAPHRGLRSSWDLPTREELPAVLARIENEQCEHERRSGYPEIGHHVRVNPPYLRRTP